MEESIGEGRREDKVHMSEWNTNGKRKDAICSAATSHRGQMSEKSSTEVLRYECRSEQEDTVCMEQLEEGSVVLCDKSQPPYTRTYLQDDVQTPMMNGMETVTMTSPPPPVKGLIMTEMKIV